MKLLIIRLAGLLWIVMGTFGLVATGKSISAMTNFVKSTRRQTLGMLSLVFGLLLLISADAAEAPLFVLALGILASIKGLAIILMLEKKFKAVMDWWLAAPQIVYRGWAILALILGVAMFYIT